MNIEDFREYCIAKKGVTEETPFGPDTLVFKVIGQSVCNMWYRRIELYQFESVIQISAIELRESYYGIRPGWHMNKNHGTLFIPMMTSRIN
jgi:predicted DNA-binding protein (MmcQ/YjbR family)